MLRYLASKRFPVLVLAFAAALAAQEPGTPAIESALADGFDVLVVKSGTNEPVGGATVSIVDISTITSAEVRAWFDDLEIVNTHRRLGRWFRADDHGLVRLPFPVWRCALRATSGDLVGMRTVDAWNRRELPPIRLELDRDVVQRVKVVDVLGRPCANVSVALMAGEEDNRVPFTTAKTGTDGIAELGHMKRVLAKDRNIIEPRVELDIHSRPGANPGIAFKSLSTEPLKLVLPEVGSVRVRAQGPGGSALTDPVQAYIRIVPRANQPSRRSTCTALTIDDAGVGRVRFADIGIGLKLEVTAFPGALRTPSLGNRHFATREFEGPTRAGQEVVVDLEFATFEPEREAIPGWEPGWDRGPVIATGIVRDPRGKPVRNAIVRYIRRAGVKGRKRTDSDLPWNGSTGLDSAGTNDDGSFELHHEPRAAEPVPYFPGAARREEPEPPEDEMAVYVVREGYVATRPYPFERGAKLEIVMDPEGTVAGRLKVDPDASCDGLHITLDYETPNESTRWLKDVRSFGRYPYGVGPGHGRFGLGERFEWVGLAAGKVVVRIGFEGRPEPLVEIGGIEVVAGQVTRDPRLQEIDLRGKLPR